MSQEVFEKKKPSLIEMILAGDEDGECLVDADKYTQEDIAGAYYDHYGEELDFDFIDEVWAKLDYTDSDWRLLDMVYTKPEDTTGYKRCWLFQ